MEKINATTVILRRSRRIYTCRFFAALRMTFFLFISVSTVFASSSEVFENQAAHFSEVQDQGVTKVVVREHPRTGRPFVSIVSNQTLSQDPFAALRKKYSRPDYRMLEAKAKTKDFAYDGPYSSSKKVYIFAAGLMTLGVGAGAVGVAMPVAATSGAAGGAGAYAVGGTAVVGTVGAVTALKSRSNPEDDRFEHSSETKTIETSKSQN